MKKRLLQLKSPMDAWVQAIIFGGSFWMCALMALSIYANRNPARWASWVAANTHYTLREAGNLVVVYGYIAMFITVVVVGLVLHWRVSRK